MTREVKCISYTQLIAHYNPVSAGESGPKWWPTPFFHGKNFGCAFLSSSWLPEHDAEIRLSPKNLVKALAELSTLAVRHCMMVEEVMINSNSGAGRAMVSA